MTMHEINQIKRINEVNSEIVGNERLGLLAKFYRNLFDVTSLSSRTYENMAAHEMVVDRGLSKHVTWVSPDGQEMVSNKLTFINRIGLITRILDKYIDVNGMPNGLPFSILMFDIDNFNAYNIKDSQNVWGGDYVISEIAHQIQMACRECSMIAQDIKLLPARYGGDEFAVLIEGSIGGNEIEYITNTLKERINSIEAYYVDQQNRVKTRNVALKDNTIDVVVVPQEVDKQRLFVEFLKKNSILSNVEMQKILDDFGDLEKLFDEIGANNTFEYPEGVQNIEDKLRWITPDTETYSTIRSHLTELDEYYKTTEFQTKALKFFERTFYNDIFEHRIISFNDFIESITQNHFDIIVVCKMKNLKDINKNFNLGRGDIILKHFFGKIKSGFDGLDIEQIKISRKGGTFFTGVSTIPTNALFMLKSLEKEIHKGIDFEYKGHQIKIPCGLTYTIVNKRDKAFYIKNRLQKDLLVEHANNIVEEKRFLVDQRCYENMVRYLVSSDENLQRMIREFERKVEDDNYTIDIKENDWDEGCFWVQSITGPESLTTYKNSEIGVPIRYIEKSEAVIELLERYIATVGENTSPSVQRLLQLIHEMYSKMKKI
jgi:diguanylate cyclase (GGDEF)-like protein